MRINANINRSGKIPAPEPLPAYSCVSKIKPSQDAPMLDFSILLIAPSAAGCGVLTYEEFLSTDRIPSRVYALLCRRDPEHLSDCWVVYFVASVYGLSDAFRLQKDPSNDVRTICMSVQTRPGQMGEYMHTANFTLLWNVRATLDMPSVQIVLRPSYDTLLLNPDGETVLKSDTQFAAGAVIYKVSDPKTTDIVCQRILAVTHVNEGIPLDLSQARLLSDGTTVAPVTGAIEHETINYHVKLWDILGLHKDEVAAQLYWSGLMYHPDTHSISVVAVKSGAPTPASSEIPTSDTVYIGTMYDVSA